MVIICFVMGVCKYGCEEGKVQANPITNKLRFASYYVFKLCFDTFHRICRTHVMLHAHKSMENYVIGKADECVSNVAMGQVNSIDEDKFVGFIESSDLLLARIFWLLILENIARLYLLKTHLKQAEKYKETTYVLVETSFNGAKVDCNTSMLVLEFQNLSFIGWKLQGELILGLGGLGNTETLLMTSELRNEFINSMENAGSEFQDEKLLVLYERSLLVNWRSLEFKFKSLKSMCGWVYDKGKKKLRYVMVTIQKRLMWELRTLFWKNCVCYEWKRYRSLIVLGLSFWFMVTDWS